MKFLRRATAVALLASMPVAAIAAEPPAPADEIIAAVPNVAMPQQERDYIGIFVKARQQFRRSRTQEGKSAARQDMQIRLHELLGFNREARDWTGVIKDVTTTADGYRAVSIEISPEIRVSTWTIRAYDAQYETMIRASSPLFHALDNAGLGDPVVFSATLIGAKIGPDSEMVERPAVIARFSAIKRLDDAPPP